MPKGSTSLWRLLLLTAVGVFVLLVILRVERDVRRFSAQLLVAQTTSDSSASASSESSSLVSSEVSSSSVSSSSSSIESSSPASSTGSSSSQDLAIPLEPGSCSAIKPDPITGQKLIYCCLDEIYIYQKEGNEAETDRFMKRLDEVQKLPGKEAIAIFEAPYDSPIHQKYDWTSLCGRKVPCEICSANHLCGNSVKEAEEKCDNGPLNSDDTPDACRLDCTLPKCGDGIIDAKKVEECDDGKQNSDRLPNACRSTCKRPSCGDRVIDTDLGETCDAGAANSDSAPDSCRSDCHLSHCGDNVTDRGEECDDGNTTDGDGCSARCAPEKKDEVEKIGCGNGIVEEGEECDSGQMNGTLPDACRPPCLRPTCGDSIRDSNEECDDGNRMSGDGCSATCTRELQLSLTKECGDGTIDEGEQCDAGVRNANGPDACRTNCIFPFCGDGITDTGEQCDDGNTVNGDGCNEHCFSEFCGDSIIHMGEECDDGNLIPGDGCDALCRKEVGSTGQTNSSGFSPPSLRPVAPSSPPSMFVSSAPALEPPAVDGIPPPLLVSPPPSSHPATQSLPIASLLPTAQWTMSETGPAALSILAMGAAVGLAWMRRKRK